MDLGADALDWDNHGVLVTADPGVRRVLLIGGSVTGSRTSGSAGGAVSPLGRGTLPDDESFDSESENLIDDVMYIANALDPEAEPVAVSAGTISVTVPARSAAILVP